MQLSKYKYILLDGDGVLWKSDTPLPGLNAFIDFLEESGIRWALLTNNNSKTIQDYIAKLAMFGLNGDVDNVFSSSSVTADYLRERFDPKARLHVVGNEKLVETLQEAGFTLSSGEEVPDQPVAAVVAGMDRQINLLKIKIAMRLIMAGAEFIATNTDGSFPTPEGISPGTGMVVGALQFSSGVEPYVVGKPQSAIFEKALQSLGGSPENSLMVGDRLETDILGANRIGMASALVLSGVTTREQLKGHQIQPDFVFEDITDLHTALTKAYQS